MSVKPILVSLFFATALSIPWMAAAQSSGENYLPHPTIRAYHPDINKCATIVVLNKEGNRAFEFYHDKQKWIEGVAKEEYSIRLQNSCHYRVLAVLSIDGFNVLTGEKVNNNQKGYVLNDYESVEIKGWRKNDKEVAAFYYTPSNNSNSNTIRLSKYSDLGVIGVAFFKEKRPVLVGEKEYTPPSEPSGVLLSSVLPESAPSSIDKFEVASHSNDNNNLERSLGTGYGRNIVSPMKPIPFERESVEPFAVWTTRYENSDTIVAKGIAKPEELSAYQKKVYAPTK